MAAQFYRPSFFFVQHRASLKLTHFVIKIYDRRKQAVPSFTNIEQFDGGLATRLTGSSPSEAGWQRVACLVQTQVSFSLLRYPLVPYLFPPPARGMSLL